MGVGLPTVNWARARGRKGGHCLKAASVRRKTRLKRSKTFGVCPLLTSSGRPIRPERLWRPGGRSSEHRNFQTKRSPGTHVNSMIFITSKVCRRILQSVLESG